MATIITTNLAKDETGVWLVAFELDDHRHLYLQFRPKGAEVDDSRSYMSIDDFLAWQPRDALHKEALQNCVEWLASSVQSGPRP